MTKTPPKVTLGPLRRPGGAPRGCRGTPQTENDRKSITKCTEIIEKHGDKIAIVATLAGTAAGVFKQGSPTYISRPRQKNEMQVGSLGSTMTTLSLMF